MCPDDKTTNDESNIGEEPRKPHTPDILPTEKWVYRLIFWIIIIGLIVPFGAQVIIPLLFCNKQSVSDALNTWNQFTSIILGICATLMSILSLVMGFYTLNQSHLTEVENTKTLTRISKALEELEEKVHDISPGKALRQTVEGSARSFHPDDEETT